MNVVIRTEGGGLSLLVDEIGDVLETSDETFEESPETVTGVARELVRGVHKLKDALLLVHNTEKTIDLTSQDSRASQRQEGD